MSSLEILNGGADQLCGIINECAEHGFTSEYIDMNHLRETEPASLTDGEIIIPLKFVEKGTKNKLGLKLTVSLTYL